MLFNTILSTLNAELKVDYVILLDLDPPRPFLFEVRSRCERWGR